MHCNLIKNMLSSLSSLPTSLSALPASLSSLPASLSNWLMPEIKYGEESTLSVAVIEDKTAGAVINELSTIEFDSNKMNDTPNDKIDFLGGLVIGNKKTLNLLLPNNTIEFDKLANPYDVLKIAQSGSKYFGADIIICAISGAETIICLYDARSNFHKINRIKEEYSTTSYVVHRANMNARVAIEAKNICLSYLNKGHNKEVVYKIPNSKV